MRALFVAATSACLAGGCGADVERIGHRAERIVSGELDSADEAVVALTSDRRIFCTGTLVSSRVVVTAAHCLYTQLTGIPVESIEVFFGTDVPKRAGTFVAVTEGQPHPGFDPEGAYDLDIGVLRLAEDAPVPPVPMAESPFSSEVKGSEIRLVGFGITSFASTDAGLKRQATAKLLSYGQFQFEMLYGPAGTCNGDSGGPAFLAVADGEVLAGVHSQSDCETLMFEERVDAHLDRFIRPFIDGPPPLCSSDGACDQTCTADPDCSHGGAPDAGKEQKASDPREAPACEGGCSMSARTHGDSWGLAGLVLSLGFVRRRRDRKRPGSERERAVLQQKHAMTLQMDGPFESEPSRAQELGRMKLTDRRREDLGDSWFDRGPARVYSHRSQPPAGIDPFADAWFR